MVFVFGSNLAGRHGKGSALYARNKLGAEYGVGEGLTGECYALPTKDRLIKTLPLDHIEQYIETFVGVATKHSKDTFLVTPIGCGLAGYEQWQIRRLFQKFELPDNIVFSKQWFQKEYNEVRTYKDNC